LGVGHLFGGRGLLGVLVLVKHRLGRGFGLMGQGFGFRVCRGTAPIINVLLLGPYSGPMPSTLR